MKEKVYAVIDLKSFYASVELLSHPDLRDTPVAVCGDPTSRHGIILAKNEPAKKLGVKTAVAFGIVCLALCALFPSQMTAIFMKVTPEVAEIAPYIIRIYAIAFLPMAVNLFATAYLQSVSKANKATVVSMLRGLILSYILLYVLPVFMGGNGIWWAVTFAEVFAAVVALWYLLPELKGIKTK